MNKNFGIRGDYLGPLLIILGSKKQGNVTKHRNRATSKRINQGKPFSSISLKIFRNTGNGFKNSTIVFINPFDLKVSTIMSTTKVSSKTPCIQCGETLSNAWFVKVFQQKENEESTILRVGFGLIRHVPLQDTIHYFADPDNAELCRECRNAITSLCMTHQKLETFESR